MFEIGDQVMILSEGYLDTYSSKIIGTVVDTNESYTEPDLIGVLWEYEGKQWISHFLPTSLDRVV